MRLPGLALAILGVAGIVVAAMIARQQLDYELPSEAPTAGSPAEDVAASQPEMRPSSNLESGQPARSVAPELIALPPIEFDRLERVDPRPPLSEVALAKPPEVPERFRVARPLASAAGRVVASGYAVAMQGIIIVEPGDICTRDDGSTWPCGMFARTAFRNFLRGRSIECRTPSGPLKGTISTDCLLGKQDVGRWLVAQGWARAAADGPYAGAEDAAKSGRLGIHGPGPSIGQ